MTDRTVIYYFRGQIQDVGINRGVSPVISVVLMVAVVVILAATVSLFALGITEDLDNPAPNVGQTSGDFIPGADDQEVRVTHVAGDSVVVENIEIIVEASGPSLNTEARLVNLPADNSDIDSENIEGDSSLVDKGFGDAGPADPNQVIIEDFPTDDNIWEAGETIQFEINVGGADFRDPPDRTGPPASTLEITIIYTTTESSSILYQGTFRP